MRAGVRAAVSAVMLVAAAASASVPMASAQSPLIDGARLQGTYGMNGLVTEAVGVPGEQAGQAVQRLWKFSPQCQKCTAILLTRQRQSGADHVWLQPHGNGYYTGVGTFTAPVRCHGRTYPRGVLVPFTISVQITAAGQIGSLVQATQLHATYTNHKRINRTRCVPAPSYDSASYSGALISV
jgi:hypothetical protein